jgi:DNA-binding PadR family transcriptional regulator
MSAPVAYTAPHATVTQIRGQPFAQRPELFLLALIRRGIATTYELKMSAAISPGAPIPVLSRLESNGFIKKGEEGARNRQEYATTAKGNALLENSWRGLFQAAPSTDLDGVMRTASLALLLDESKRSVAEYLSRASGLRRAVKAEKPARPGGCDYSRRSLPLDAPGCCRWPVQKRSSDPSEACERRPAS